MLVECAARRERQLRVDQPAHGGEGVVHPVDGEQRGHGGAARLVARREGSREERLLVHPTDPRRLPLEVLRQRQEVSGVARLSALRRRQRRGRAG